MDDLPEDVAALRLWAKAGLDEYGLDILNSNEAQAVVEMAIETAFRLGRTTR